MALQVQLHIWDKASENGFITLEEAFFIGARVGLLVFSSTDRASFDGLRAMKRSAEKMAQLQGDGSDIQWVIVQHKVDELDEMHVGTGTAHTAGSSGSVHLARELPPHASPPATVSETGKVVSGSSTGTTNNVHSQTTARSGPARACIRSAELESGATTASQLSVQAQPLTKSSSNSSRATIAAVENRTAKSHRCVSTCVHLSAILIPLPMVGVSQLECCPVVLHP